MVEKQKGKSINFAIKVAVLTGICGLVLFAMMIALPKLKEKHIEKVGSINSNEISHVRESEILSKEDWSENHDNSIIATLIYDGVWNKLEVTRAQDEQGNLLGNGRMRDLDINAIINRINEDIDEVEIGDNIKNIGAYSFYGFVNVKEVTISESVEEIGEGAFSDCCEFTEIRISKNVKSIGAHVFDNCLSLAKIIVDKDNINYCSDGWGVLYNKSKTELIRCPENIVNVSGGYEIPNTVTTIKKMAFYQCKKLSKVIIPNTIKSIEDMAFYKCSSLQIQVILDKTVNVGKDIFKNCGKATIICNKNTSAYNEAKQYNYLALDEEYEIKNSYIVLKKDFNTTYTIDLLEAAIEMQGVDKLIKSEGLFDDILETGDYLQVNGITQDEAITLEILIVETEWDISAEGEENKVTALLLEESEEVTLIITGTGKMKDWSSALGLEWYDYRMSIEKVEIGDGVLNIGSNAFSGCKALVAVNISPNVRIIEENTFYDCTSLAEVSMSDYVTKIEDRAFYNCNSLNEISIPGDLESIGVSAFEKCTSLTTVEMGYRTQVIGESAFKDCSNLTNITLSKYIENINQFAFAGCEKLSQINIPIGVVNINPKAFSGCKVLENIYVNDENVNYQDIDGVLYTKEKDGQITLVRYPEGKTSEKYTIESKTTVIGLNSFEGATYLEYVYIPDGAKIIETAAFFGCTGLKEIVIPSNVENIGSAVFCKKGEENEDGDSENEPLDVIIICKKDTTAYDFVIKNSYDNSYFATTYDINNDNIEIIEVDNIIYSTFKTNIETDYGATYKIIENGTAITDNSKIKIGQKLQIGTRIFDIKVLWDISENADKTVIAELESNGTLTISGSGAMKQWVDTTSSDYHSSDYKGLINTVNINKDITNIGNHAFYNFENLTNINIEAEITSIGTGAFKKCSKLTSIDIPNGITKINAYAFAHSGLNNITIPESVTIIKEKTFFDCANLTNVVMTDSVKEIENFAFAGCENLKTISVPNNLEKLGNNVFENCSKLSTITIPKTLTSIGTSVFSGVEGLGAEKRTNIVKYYAVNQTMVDYVSTTTDYKDLFQKLELQNIIITKGPDKTVYRSGTKFDRAGMSVQIVYDDGVTTRVLDDEEYTIRIYYNTDDGQFVGDTEDSLLTFEPKEKTIEVVYKEKNDAGYNKIVTTKKLNDTENLLTITVNPNILTINPNGGTFTDKEGNSTYDESTGTYTGDYDTTIIIANEGDLIPAPGYEITLNANKGKFVEIEEEKSEIIKTSTKSFSKWVIEEGSIGTLNDEKTGMFKFGEGNATLIAEYTNDAMQLPSPTRDGYIFEGWFLDENLETAITLTEDGKYITEQETTLYAKWSQIEYIVKYNANNGTLPEGVEKVEDTIFTYDKENEKLAKNIFIREGYTFKEWNTSSNGTGTSYTDEQIMPNVAINEGETVTLYAIWQANKYTVQYDGNGADEGTTTESSEHTYDEEKSLTTNGFEKTGYIFAGWNTSQDGSGTPYKDQGIVANLTSENNATVILYAQWTPITYTIKYDRNGEVGGDTTSSTHTYDELKKLTANVFYKTGYKFVSWNTIAEGTGESYSDEEEIKNLATEDKSTVTLYAQWVPIEYTIVYDGNGADEGTLTQSSDHIYNETKNLTKNGFVRTGYTFTGWRDENGKNYVDGSEVNNCTKDDGTTIILYAQWTINSYNLTINYIYEDGSEAADSYVETLEYNKEYSVNSPEIRGYTADDKVVEGTMGAENTEITVKYMPNTETPYTVEHYKQNIENDEYTIVSEDTEDDLIGTTGTETEAKAKTYEGFTAQKISQEKIKGDGSTVVKVYYTRNTYEVVYKVDGQQHGEKEYHKYGASVTVRDVPEKDGYTFSGWTVKEGAIPTIMPAKNVEITGTFTVNKYTITFTDENGDVLKTQSVAYGETPEYDGETPTKEGTAQYTYTFKGWTPNIVAVTGNATYKAEYTETVNKYTVTFNVNGGVDVEEVANAEYGTEITLPIPTKEGYKFKGWYTDEKLETAVKLTEGKYIVSEEVTLHAKWEAMYLKTTSEEHQIDGEKLKIRGIKPETTVGNLKETLESNISFEILDSEGNVVQETKVVGTGYKVKLENGIIYTLIVKGDLNGDGKISPIDISRVKLHLVETKILEGPYYDAADLNGDGKVQLRTLSKLKLYLVGLGVL